MTGGLEAPVWYAGQSEEGVWPQVAWSCWSGQQDLKQKEQFHNGTKQPKLSFYSSGFTAHPLTAEIEGREHFILNFILISLKEKRQIQDGKWKEERMKTGFLDEVMKRSSCPLCPMNRFAPICVSHWPGTWMNPAVGCFISRIRLLCFTWKQAPSNKSFLSLFRRIY